MTATSHNTQLIQSLNQILAHTIDLKLQAKQAHWNVKGENFMPLHMLFDQIATEATEYADLFAERVMQLGGMAQGTLQVVATMSTLLPYPTDIQGGQEHLKALISALHFVCEQARHLIDIAAADNDAVTADLCTEIARGLDKSHWFLRSHLMH
jgi:starvation-inducible DNA-binding protein